MLYVSWYPHWAKKWKIKTSQQKFQIVAFEQGPKKPFRVDATDRRKIIEDSNEGRFFGLFLNRNGLSGPVKRRSNQAKAALTSLQRFRGLASKCKKNLCTSLVKARLVYPCVQSFLNFSCRSATFFRFFPLNFTLPSNSLSILYLEQDNNHLFLVVIFLALHA